MSPELPQVPRGSGKHPVPLIVLAANRLEESAKFYAACFGWKVMSMSPQLRVAMPPSGPSLALRSGNPEGFQSAVPFIGVADVKASLEKVIAAGGKLEHGPWEIPVVGTLARFADPSGTLYGLTSVAAPGGTPHVPMPFGANPKPAARTICSLEMYAKDGAAAAAWFGAQFGWGSLQTMPHYMAFDAGAGVGGVFQSHTPALPGVAYVYVEDVKASLDEIETLGGERIGDPMPMPGLATFGYFKDPSGTAMGLIGP